MAKRPFLLNPGMYFGDPCFKQTEKRIHKTSASTVDGSYLRMLALLVSKQKVKLSNIDNRGENGRTGGLLGAMLVNMPLIPSDVNEVNHHK